MHWMHPRFRRLFNYCNNCEFKDLHKTSGRWGCIRIIRLNWWSNWQIDKGWNRCACRVCPHECIQKGNERFLIIWPTQTTIHGLYRLDHVQKLVVMSMKHMRLISKWNGRSSTKMQSHISSLGRAGRRFSMTIVSASSADHVQFSWLFNCQLLLRKVMKVSELFITSWSDDAQVHWFKLSTIHYRRFVAKFAAASSNNFSLLHVIPVATQLVKFQLRNAWSRFILMQIT